MSTKHSDEFLCWFDDWANRHALNKATRRKLLEESEDIDGILFLAAVACSNEEVEKFVSGNRQKTALLRALASLGEEDNVKTESLPFGAKSNSRHVSTSSDVEEESHQYSPVPRVKKNNLNISARYFNDSEERDWSCGLCRFFSGKLCSSSSKAPQRMESCYDCFECNRSFCQQNDLTAHICQVHK